jgi:alpha-beta hydrolase superfamily lysophospholipase
MEYHVVFIHGTFAQWSRWPKLDEVVVRALPPPVHLHYFEWSGRNTVRARADAAKELVSEVRRVTADATDARIYFIGHSHGGNVAFLALKDRALRARTSLVICLSTPFISARYRPFGRLALVQAILGLSCWAALGGQAKPTISRHLKTDN